MTKAIDARDPDAMRRRLLLAAPFAMLASCAPATSMPSAFSARFLVAGAGPIALDYLDERNFTFTPDIGWGATCVVAGRIYLVMLPSLATASRTRVLWAGDIGPPAKPPTSSAGPALSLRPSAVPASTQRRWRLQAPAQDLAIPATSGAAPTVATVADLPPLARAQYAIDTRMRPNMDMSLCGDGVNRLVASWSPQITGRGLAVLASTMGVQLAASLSPLARYPALPSGVEIEDFRIAFGSSR